MFISPRCDARRMPGMTHLTNALFALLLLAPAADAVQVYRCVSRDGAVSYQDKPCPARQKQSTVSLQDAPIVSSVSAPPISVAPARVASATPRYEPPPA